MQTKNRDLLWPGENGELGLGSLLYKQLKSMSLVHVESYNAL